MAQVGISEFSFGFGFLSEQTRHEWTNLRIASVLPSLQQEQYEGWDAHLPLLATDYYYQFKLSDYLERRNSKYWITAKHTTDRIYDDPYYRIALHRRNWNQQHQRLKLHSTNNPHTYYVAPEFHSLSDFNSAFLSQQLVQRSRLIPLTDCKYISDNEQHYITFQTGSSKWRFHSEPELHESSVSGQNIERLYQRGKRQFRELDKTFATELFHKASESVDKALTEEKKPKRRSKTGDEELLESIEIPERAREESNESENIELLRYEPRYHECNDIIKRTSQILSVFFGLTLVLVGVSEQ